MDASEWTGAVGDVWAAEWQRTDRTFADLAPRLNAAIRAALPDTPGRVADVGCGAGATTIALAADRGDMQVTGFDISPALVAIARQRAAGLPNATFVAGAVEQAIGPAGPFDLIVSRHGVMFFDDPVAGLAALRDAATPGTSLVFSCFRSPALNPWANDLVAAMLGATPVAPDGHAPGPFAFADEAFVRATLAAAGWVDATAEAVDFTYRAGEGDDPVADAVGFLRRIGPAARALRLADHADRPAMLARLAAYCDRHRTGNVVDFPAAAWLWSAQNRSIGERA